MEKEFAKFNISQKGVVIRGDKCLILRLSHNDEENPLKWDIPGGRLDQGENYNGAFQREIREEIGFKEFGILGFVGYGFNIREHKQTCILVSLIENNHENVLLSDEHIEMEWISESKVDDYEYYVPFLADLIRKGFQINKLLKK